MEIAKYCGKDQKCMYGLTALKRCLLLVPLLITFYIAEDQSGNFFTRERELFVKVVSEYIREYQVVFTSCIFYKFYTSVFK